MTRRKSGDDQARLEQYSAALIRELEEKTRQLEATNSRLVDAQRVAHMGSWEIDLDTGAVVWSAETARILEMELDAATDADSLRETRHRLRALIHPDDRASVRAAVGGFASQTDGCELDHRLVMPDGRVKFVVERWEVARDADGRAVRVLGTCQDVTDRTLAESEMRRTAALLQAVANGTPDALFVKDRDGRYLFFNASSAERAGTTVENVLGGDDRAVFGEAEAAQIMETDRLVMETRQTVTTEERLTAAGGATRTYLAIKSPYFDEDGNVIGVVGIARDVTERKQAEEAVRESEQRYREAAAQLANVLDQSLDVICSFDIRGRFVQVNAACERVLGYSPEELLGAGALDHVAPEDHAKTRRAAAATIAGEAPANFENRYVRKDGVVTNIQWAARWSDEDQMMFCVGRDITAQRNLEAQVLRAQRMESIGTLAGGIAHDLNNALAPIVMAIDLLRMDEQDPQRLAILTTLDTSARRGADMVRQLLSFARGVDRNPVDTNLGSLVADVARIADETFLKTIQVRTELPADLWPVHCDPTQIHQVLLNLCVNARDAMLAGGSLTITASNVQLDQRDATLDIDATAGPYVRVVVADTGAGMTPEILDRAFEPFFTTKQIGHGTGLGLSTSLAIVKSHGGFVRVDSRVGHGTSVDVYLPASPAAIAAEPVITAARLPRGNGELVLVVDDEEAVREITQRTLDAFGYRCLVAADGVEALRVFEQRGSEISVVLTDMMMPNSDGPTMIEALLRIDPAIRIVAASGLNEIGMAARAAALGVDHVVPKPFDAETLLVTLERVLHRSGD